MPPQRTIPPAKVVKTERTHEENQERAYIAASRRSDRSLEARVESARRASEIHKRRTGRSLRVTEQDVVNEEMYEEEDDDLPMQYRRLTAHLQTGSADFNRRLSAYLTNHVAMRSALDQAVQNSYAQQYPNAPQFARSQASMYQSPMLAHQAQQIMHQNMPLPNMQMPTNPAIYGQYDNQQAAFRPSNHGRSASIAVPREAVPNSNLASPTMLHDTGRRMSMPATLKTEISDLQTIAQPMSATIPQARPPVPQNNFALSLPYLPQYNMDAFAGDPYSAPPFSTSLPPESQLLLGSNLNHTDPLTAMFMAGAEQFGLNTCGYNASNSQNSMNKVSEPILYPAYTGLDSTLAGGINPSQLDLNMGGDYLNPRVLDIGSGNLSANATGAKLPSGQESAAGTPGLNGDNWDQYIDEGQWDIPTSSQ